MPFRTRSFRPFLWSVALLAVSAAPGAAQPPSPLELVRGLRENGQVDLALQYLKEIEGKPLSPDDKAAILLERAKCLLDASEAEPDEGTRLGMVAEAREGLNAFLISHPKHPRAVEALLSVAKLTALDAREQLNRARRMDIPPASDNEAEKAAREAAQAKQKAEAKKARPLFLLAAKRFSDASDRLRTQLEDKTLDYNTRKALQREAFEAKLASGINQFDTADTYMPASSLTGAEKQERNKLLEQAKAVFTELAKGPPSSRTVWAARAWAAEVTFEQDDFNTAEAEVRAILNARVLEAEEGKRLARFFQLRRNFLAAMSGGEGSLTKAVDSERELRTWLRLYGNARKPTPEVFSVQYYLARVLQALAESTITVPKDGKPIVLSNTERVRLTEAEKRFRTLSQTDNEYTDRAARQRMAVVRRLLGDADKPPAEYTSFENAQMASLIQMSKLAAAEAMPEKTDEERAKKTAEIRNRQLKAIALLQRARALATPEENPADVTDVLLRLIYFYQLTDQPYQAAVLGEYGARTLRSTGGKAALAGLLGLNGYLVASRRAKGDVEAATAARQIDRDRAVALARFLDEKYPNDNATDAARHQLASLLMEDKKYHEAFDTIIKVRPGYGQINDARQLEGYLAAQLVIPKDSPLTDAQKADVFRRAVADLAKVAKPAPVALEGDVRDYLSARCRLATLLFAQGRADPAAERANPGYNQAFAISQEVLALVPTFDSMVTTEGGTKKLNVDGLEMTMLARDANARAVYLRARALMDADKLDEAEKALAPVLADVRANGAVFAGAIQGWAAGRGDLIDPKKPDTEENRDPRPVAVQKARVAQLAALVDKTRVEVILAGFRLKVKQGKANEAAELLDLMVKSGGTVEDNIPVLELLGREMAAQMNALRKDGKKAEADALGAGLAVLLKKINAVPELTPRVILFLGQTLQAVGENDQAVETMKKIKPPEFAGWDTKKPEEIPQELRGRVQNQIRDYSIAQLTIARALSASGKHAEAEAMLNTIIGTNDAPGWGYSRLYFRRELAAVYEAKGAALTDLRAANAEWGKALREWATLFGMHRRRVASPPKDVSPDQMKQYRNSFAEAFFDYQRCVVRANEQLLKSQPAKLQQTYDKVGKEFANMEKQIPAADWEPDVHNLYAGLLKDTPPLLAVYKAAGGKLFLEPAEVP